MGAPNVSLRASSVSKARAPRAQRPGGHPLAAGSRKIGHRLGSGPKFLY